MMLLVVSEGESLDSYVADDFGHAPFFLLVDSDTLDYRVIVNEFRDSPSGAGVAVAEAIVSLGNVDAVLTGGIGMHGVDILSKAGIQVSADEDGTVEECIKDYLRRRERQAAFESRRRVKPTCGRPILSYGAGEAPSPPAPIPKRGRRATPASRCRLPGRISR